MCIAILNNKGIIDKKTFLTCWANNPDGAGIAYYDGAKIQIIKEMNSPRKLYKTYKELRQKYSPPFLIHFRISTHGKVNLSNCHPFKINEQAAFIHNGVIYETAYEGDYSDTYYFNELILKKLPIKLILNEAGQELLTKYIDFSKLVFLIKDTPVIINESKGMWDGGNWYSNDTYKESPPCPAKTTYKEYQYTYESPCDYCGYQYGANYHAPLNSYLCSHCEKTFKEEPRYYDELN